MALRTYLSAVAAVFLSACGVETTDPADSFMAQLHEYCGGAFTGRVVSTDEVDKDFAQQHMIMHVRECTDKEIRIPFHVGDDRSRTWVVTRTGGGVRLKHDHRHEDGGEDAVTQYGGDSANIVSAERIEFPVDEFSINLFEREELTASVTNVWAMEVSDGVFAYELKRENRFFRVEFDLTNRVGAPPPPWGAN